MYVSKKFDTSGCSKTLSECPMKKTLAINMFKILSVKPRNLMVFSGRVYFIGHSDRVLLRPEVSNFLLTYISI